MVISLTKKGENKPFISGTDIEDFKVSLSNLLCLRQGLSFADSTLIIDDKENKLRLLDYKIRMLDIYNATGLLDILSIFSETGVKRYNSRLYLCFEEKSGRRRVKTNYKIPFGFDIPLALYVVRYYRIYGIKYNYSNIKIVNDRGEIKSYASSFHSRQFMDWVIQRNLDSFGLEVSQLSVVDRDIISDIISIKLDLNVLWAGYYLSNPLEDDKKSLVLLIGHITKQKLCELQFMLQNNDSLKKYKTIQFLPLRNYAQYIDSSLGYDLTSKVAIITITSENKQALVSLG